MFQVITASEAEPKALRDLRNRCLNPGKYAQHLERWLACYPPQQLYIIDGEQLKTNPVTVMNDLQRFLKLPPFDYSRHLRFDNKKGFYCQVVSDNRNKCLGKSKGRQYPPMDDRSAKMLQKYVLFCQFHGEDEEDRALLMLFALSLSLIRTTLSLARLGALQLIEAIRQWQW